METVKRTSLQRVMVAIAAFAVAMAMAPLAAWAAPAGSGDSLAPAGASLQAQAAADPIDVYMTVSNEGTLALAHQKVTVTDLDKDGAFTYDEALKALHKEHKKGGYATTVSDYGLQVTKFWGVEGTTLLFYQNDTLCALNVGEQAIAAGDDLVCAIMADLENWSDHYAFFTKKQATVTAGKNLTLTAKAFAWGDPFAAQGLQLGVWDNGTFTKLDGVKTNASGKATLSFDEPGTYVVSASGTVDDEAAGQTNCPIAAPYCEVTVIGANPMTATAVAAKNIPAATYGKAKTIAASKAITVKDAQGKVTYKKVSGAQKITVANNGKITVKKGIAAGTYKVKIAVKAAGNDLYKAATKNVTVKITVNKAKNTMKATAAKKTVKLATVTKKAVTVAPLTVKNAKGTKAFKVTKWTTAKAKNYIKVNAKNGKVTVKKGTPKGTYKFSVKVTAKGTANYKVAKVTKAVTVKVA